MVSFLFLSVILWSSRTRGMSWNHHTGTQRSLAAIGARGTPSPYGVQDSLPQTLLRLGSLPLSTCGSQMEPWGPGRGCCWPSCGTWRLGSALQAPDAGSAWLSSTAFTFSQGYCETNQIHEAKKSVRHSDIGQKRAVTVKSHFPIHHMLVLWQLGRGLS